MSAEQNLNVFRQVIDEGFNRVELDHLDNLFAGTVIEHQFGMPPNVEGVKNSIRFLHKAFPDFHLEIDELIAHDDKVWARMTGRGTNLGGIMGPPNGKSFEIAVFDVCRFENGKIVEHWGAPDRFAQMSQLGLLPERQPQGQ